MARGYRWHLGAALVATGGRGVVVDTGTLPRTHVIARVVRILNVLDPYHLWQTATQSPLQGTITGAVGRSKRATVWWHDDARMFTGMRQHIDRWRDSR